MTAQPEPPPGCPPNSCPTGSLHWAFSRLAKAFSTVDEEIVRRHGLSLRGYTALVEIVNGGAESQLALSRSAGLDKSRLVGLLDELERGGFVTRRPDPIDRRARIIEPTAKGRREVGAAAVEIHEAEQQFFAGLEPRDRDAFLDVVRHLMEHELTPRLGEGEC